MTATPPENATTTELVTWIFERLNAHDLDALQAVWTDDTVERAPDGTIHGAAEATAYFEAKFAGLEGFNLEVLRIIAEGDEAFVHWKLTGTHTGRVAGIEATGKKISADGIDHMVLRDGTLLTNTVVFDQMEIARQLGILPRDGTIADTMMKAPLNATFKTVAAVRKRRDQRRARG